MKGSLYAGGQMTMVCETGAVSARAPNDSDACSFPSPSQASSTPHPSTTQAMSAGGSAGGSDHVWIKLDKDVIFAHLKIEGAVFVGEVATIACKEFPRWRLDAGQVRLFRVAKAGDEPTEEEVGAARATEPLAVSAAVPRGAWLEAATQHTFTSPASSFVPGRLSFGGGGGGGSSAAERTSPTPPAANLPSVSEAVGPIFEGEARDVMSALFLELCPWATDHSPLLSRTLNRGGNQREADVMCYIEGDTLAPCAALATSGACLVELPNPGLSALPPMPLPAGRRFSPTDASRKGPHKYFLAEVYSGHKTRVWAEKVVQLETLCERLKIRWQDQQSEVEGLPPVTDITQVVGAAALIFSVGDGKRLEVLQRAQEKVAHSAAQCPNLARLAVAGRLLVIVLDKSQAPSTFVQRSLALHLDRLQGIPEDMADVRRGLGGLAAQLESLTAAVRGMKFPPQA